MKKEKDPLTSYKQKRNFTVTPEPNGGSYQKNTARAFVIQKHDARSTHYDLRLELDGVLKSWAIPKGPSLEPGQKRLAVNVEDHPLEYLAFEGTIPPHQYGAGNMIIWDSGVWEPIGDPAEGLKAGHLKFYLRGQKLQGAWVLVKTNRTTGENKDWLLIKEHDENTRLSSDINLTYKTTANSSDDLFLHMPSGARPGPIPSTITPQLATLVNEPPTGDDWIFEIKFDGYRILTRYDDQDSVALYTRNGNDWTSKLINLVPALKELNVAPGWLDGEIVILRDNGVPDFGALQSAFDTGRTDEIVYFVFDLPYYAGYDLRETSLTSRRILLTSILKYLSSSRIRFSENFTGSSPDIYSSACSLGLEGVMGKRKDSFYVSGRSQSWIKLKCTKRQEFVIVGYTPPEISGKAFKSLLLGVHDEDGKLHYAGKVGTGFNVNNSTMIQQQLDRLASEITPLNKVPPGVKAKWLKPELVAEVAFTELTKDGKVRHGVFKSLRSDKKPGQINIEKPVSLKTASFNNARSNQHNSSPDITISNPDRIVDPSTALRKLDIVNYYKAAARWILPYLFNRPASLVRAPAGLEGELFFQKHADKLRFPGLKELKANPEPGHPSPISIDSVEALIGAAQMNVIEFHTGNAKASNIAKPDRMVFDLDPGEGTSWAMMMEAAQLVRTLLEELELKSFLKTSGGKGLHVVVPLKPRDDWETVKAFTKGVASHLSRIVPSYFTDVSGPDNRINKIFIDYNRNSRSATTVEAFSARARAGMGVSMPCSWQELSLLTSGAHWTIVNAGFRLEREEDPWKEYNKTKQILTSPAKKIMLGTKPCSI